MPELIDGKWIIRRSEVSTFTRCPKAWHAQYVDHLYPIEFDPENPDPDDNRTQGTWWHSILAAGLLAMKEHGVRSLVDGMLAERERLSKECLLPDWINYEIIVAWGAWFARERPYDEIVAVEYTLQLPTPGSWQTLWPGLALQGTLDVLGRDRYGNITIGEHKSSGRSVEQAALDAVYEIDDQITCYNLLMASELVLNTVVDVTRKVDMSRTKTRAAVVGSTIQTRGPTATANYWGRLQRTIQGMERLAPLDLDDLDIEMRINPHPWESCFCPSGMAPYCAAVIHGEDYQGILERMYKVLPMYVHG